MQFIIIGIVLLFTLIPSYFIIRLYVKAIKKRKEDINKQRELRDKTIEYLDSIKDKGE